MANVENWLPFMSKYEGGYVNNPADKGGATNRGITLATWKQYAPALFGLKGTLTELKNLTDTQWRAVAKKYWDAVMCDQITSQAVAECIADYYWGSGSWAIQRVQMVLNGFFKNVSVDMVMGNQTLTAINEMNGELLAKAICNMRKQHLREIVKADPTQIIFLQGWLNRVNDLEKKLKI